ncbi:MAG TPA: WSD1 family O-acyltransferase [Phycisphaerales bacterium]|nr:WSD1 family O-acyltransferase [Phycisphaerales bacterium]
MGQRIHLATDSRIKAKEIQDILREELRVKIKLAEPTFHRNFQLPVLAGTLRKLKQPRVAHAITKLDDIFGGYSERNQPVHEVGNDVTILGMPEQRPNTKEVFRMVCRHNKYVQDFGKIRDLNVIKEGTVVRAVVPVDLRRRSGEELGNKFGLVFMNLPIGIADPREQLAAVKAFMNELKESPQAVMVLGLLSAVGTIPAELEKRVVGLFGASATAVLTNVPGPQEPLLLAGKEISSLMFWVPQSGGLGLGLSILSYNQQVRVGIATDAGLVDKPELLVQDVEAAFEELLRIECGELVTS